ncbi:MAG TPA: hypothetical protein VH087_18080 [Thermoanaerobaculia bacterium]|jgi:hypothetical protein|nr:hypothetical protein [Thermoanaerobaculia bacterium]
MEALGPEVLQLIGECIDSLESLEALALLYRSPDTFWSADAVAAQIGARADIVGQKLQQLAAAGLLARAKDSVAYRYAPAAVPRCEGADLLLRAFAKRRVDVVNAIYSSNLERLRAFSNAFRLKKK